MDTKTNIYLLSNTQYEGVNNLPLIEINFLLQPIDFFHVEALIFTSKNAVKALEKINPSWKKLPAYCIGEGTAKEVKRLCGNVAYVATNSYGNDFASEIGQKLAYKKVLFLRAKTVLSNIEEILKSLHVKLISHIVYETTCKQEKYEKPGKGAIIIFTSPSTVQCFFKQFSWDETYRAVCIGNVTAKYLLHVKPVYVSEKQSIQACINLANTLDTK